MGRFEREVRGDKWQVKDRREGTKKKMEESEILEKVRIALWWREIFSPHAKAESWEG